MVPRSISVTISTVHMPGKGLAQHRHKADTKLTTHRQRLVATHTANGWCHKLVLTPAVESKVCERCVLVVSEVPTAVPTPEKLCWPVMFQPGRDAMRREVRASYLLPANGWVESVGCTIVVVDCKNPVLQRGDGGQMSLEVKEASRLHCTSTLADCFHDSTRSCLERQGLAQVLPPTAGSAHDSQNSPLKPNQPF